MSFLLIGIIAVVVVMTVIGAVKGFANVWVGVASLVLSIFLAWVVTPFVKDLVVKNTEIETGVAEGLSEKLLGKVETEEALDAYFSKMPLPEGIRNQIRAAAQTETGVEQQKTAVCTLFADWILTAVIDIILFVIMGVILSLLGKALTKAIKKSSLQGTDRVLGGLFGAAEGVLLADAILLLIPLLSTTEFGKRLYEQVTASPVMEWIYNHNVISMLISSLTNK